MGFTENQKDVIEYGHGTLLVEAGPGSGKTTVIVERIKYLIKQGVDPESFLVITFTNKATDNLKYKLRKELSNEIVSKMQISTIHSFCLEYLKSKDIQLNLIDDDASEKKSLLIKKFKRKLGFTGYSTVLDYQFLDVLNKFAEYSSFKVDTPKLLKSISDSRVITQEYIDFVNSMDYFSKKRLDDHDKPLENERSNDPENFDDTKLFKKSWYNARFLKIIEAYDTYLDLLDEYDYVDYNTLQIKTLEVLKNDSDIQYKTVFVDEFQDTDPLQFRIFQNLKESCDYFTAVGDVDQHIYAFRSSFNDFFDELVKLENHVPIPLNVNFRSTENIVNLTEEFIKPQRKDSSEKDMENDREDINNHNFLIENENSEEEAEKIYEIIKYLKDNDLIEDYSDIAVLYRKHSDKTLTYLTQKLTDDNIEFSIKGQKDLSKQDEVKSIMTLMWYISRKIDVGHIPSKDELKEYNLKAFCGEYFDTIFWKLNQSTIDYLNDLQNSFNREVIRVENEFRKERGARKVSAVHNVKKNEDQDTLIKIFNRVQVPVIDLDKIDDPTDKEFFIQLESIRNEIHSNDPLIAESENKGNAIEQLSQDNESEENDKEPLTILKAFYKLISLSNLYDYELSYNEIANLAILTQTISNYETFISDTYFRGAYFFLKDAIENYDSYQNEDSGVQLMTIHSAKGLEFPVTIINSLEKGKFPSENKDPNREKDNIFPNDTYYTPNECLEYKTTLKKDEKGNWIPKTLSIEEENEYNLEEEDRVLYVAMTRAKDLLILSTIGEVPEQIERIRDHTERYSLEKLSQVEIASKDENEELDEEPVDDLEQLEEPVVLNYSKYTQYLSCPFKYDLGNNLGFRRFGSAKAANKGSVFHEIMEELNLKLLEGEIADNEKIDEIIIKHYKPMFDIKEDDSEFEEFRKHVRDYYRNYSIKREVLESEFNFELFRDNYVLNGAIDLVYKEDNGEVVILDYKYADYDEDHIDGYKKQSYIYTSALREIPEYEKYDIKKAYIHFVKSDTLYPVDIDEKVMEDEKENLSVVAGKIKDKIFLKEPEKPHECGRCSYRYFCKPKEFAQQLYD